MKAYYRESKEEVLKELGANEQQGLTSKADQEKLAQVGPNALVEGKKKSVVEVFLEQFKDLMVIILIVTEKTVIRANIAFQPWVVCTC